MLNLVFNGIDAAKQSLHIPSWLDDPLAIWGSFLFQLAWSRIPNSGLFTSNSTEANDTFQTLWPKTKGDEPRSRVTSESISEFNNRKLYHPESTSGVIWAIDSMEGELNIDGESKASRLEFHPPLNLYIPPGDTDGVKASQAYFPLVWSGNDTTSSTIKIAFANTPDIAEHEIVNVQLIKGQHSSCDLEPIPKHQLHAIARNRESAAYLPLCGLDQARECSGIFQCSVLEVHLGREQTTTLYTDTDVAVRISFHDDAENTEKESNKSLDNRQKTRILMGFDIPKSLVNRPDFNKPKIPTLTKTGQRVFPRCVPTSTPPSSWLKQKSNLMAEFMLLGDAKHIIEAIRRGEDYQTKRKYECCCPQNGITNIVSRLDDLVTTSITALQLFQSMDKNQVLQHLHPMSARVPDGYKEFVCMQEENFESVPNCQVTQILQTEDRGQSPVATENVFNCSPVDAVDFVEGWGTRRKRIEQLCYELRKETNLSHQQIGKILKKVFGKNTSGSASHVRNCIKRHIGNGDSLPSLPEGSLGHKANENTHSFLAYSIDPLEILVCCDLSCYDKNVKDDHVINECETTALPDGCRGCEKIKNVTVSPQEPQGQGENVSREP